MNLRLSFKRLFDRGCAGRFARLSAGEKGIRTPGPVTDDEFEIVLFSYSIVPVTARNNNSFPSGTNGSNPVCSSEESCELLYRIRSLHLRKAQPVVLGFPRGGVGVGSWIAAGAPVQCAFIY